MDVEGAVAVEGARILDRAEPDSDARHERMDRVAVLYAEITAATRAFLAALAESDRHEDWKEEGFGSCAEWLAWRISVTRNTANEKVRVARALEHLPRTSEAMARGELSFSKVRALTRAATPDNETELLALARAGSAAKLERVVRSWRDLDRWSEAERERARHRRRSLSVFPGDDGMYVVKGVLPPEVGAALMRAVEAAGDALFRGASSDPEDEPPEPRQLRADALGLVAERALAAGFGRAAGDAAGDAAGGSAGDAAGSSAPISGTRAERYQVMLHVDEATLSEDREPGMSELEDGTRVSAETARRLCCDAAKVEIRKDGEGNVLDVGRKTRTVPPALRRALEVRDRGCRFPGCGLRFTDGHHIIHWIDGGTTDLANTMLLCQRHHRRVHEGGWRVSSDRTGRKIVFFTPKGRALFEAPPMPELAGTPGEAPPPSDPASPLVRRNRQRGIRPDPWAITQTCNRDSQIPWEVEAAAWEALDAWEEEAAAVDRRASSPGTEPAEVPLQLPR